MLIERPHDAACTPAACRFQPGNLVHCSATPHKPTCCASSRQPAPSQQLSVGVHVAAVPLVGPFEVAERRLGRLYPDQLALHTLVILEEPNGTCTAYDFLPLEPTSPLTTSRWVLNLSKHPLVLTV